MIVCKCGYNFPESTGKYGCPNCNGDSHNNPIPCAARQARSRKARAKAGGKQIAVMLSPQAATKLVKLQMRGESIAGVVNRLLEESKP